MNEPPTGVGRVETLGRVPKSDTQVTNPREASLREAGEMGAR